MLRFIRNTLSNLLDDEDQISDFVSYKKIETIGCPSQVSALSFDDSLGLLFIASCEGKIIIMGGEKTIWSCWLPNANEYVPQKLLIAKGFGMAVVEASSRTETKLFHIFISGRQLKILEIPKDHRWKVTTACVIIKNCDNRPILLQGTQGGNLAQIYLDNFSCEEFLRSDSPLNEKRLNSFPIIHLVASPDFSMLAVVQMTNTIKETDSENVESENKFKKSDCFITIIDVKTQQIIRESALDVDSVMIENLIWSLANLVCIQLTNGTCIDYHLSCEPMINNPQTMFGAFPSKGLKQIQYCECKRNGDEKILLFIGGVLDTVFGDRHIVTLKSKRKTCSFELGSPVLNIEVVQEYDEDDKKLYASTLIILAKKEIVFIDLQDEHWRPLPPRFLFPMDAHDITCTENIADITTTLIQELKEASEQNWASDSRYSPRLHPQTDTYFNKVAQNSTSSNESTCRQLLLVGFSDGTLNVINAGEKNCTTLFRIDTKLEYDNDSNFEQSSVSDSSESEFHFCKVGTYDPYSDDPGLELLCVTMDKNTGLIAMGTKMGTIFVHEPSLKSSSYVPDVLEITMADSTIMSHSKVKKIQPATNMPRTTEKTYIPGYQPYAVAEKKSFYLQCNPNTPIFSISLLGGRDLLAFGTEFGFAVVHLRSNTVIFKKSFIDLHDLHEICLPTDTWSVFKSMKKSIRDTFRRRKRTRDEELSTQNHDNALEDNDNNDDLKPIERKIEGRSYRKDEYKPWLVRVVKFIQLPWISGIATDILFVGTNGGNLLCLSIHDSESKLSITLEKEILLSHGAPIINVEHFVDLSSKGGAVSRLLIVTQEQIRLYIVPVLKCTNFKLKLTRREGIKARKSKIIQLVSEYEDHKHNFLMILTNMGEIRIQSLTNPGKYINLPLSLANNHLAMEHAVLTSRGEFIYLRTGQSEFQRIICSIYTCPEWSSETSSS